MKHIETNDISHQIFSSNLDSEQLQAVLHRGSNLLILAGAGSGKTHTLTHRAISFLNEIDPLQLMVITFTKKAAKELKDRITKEVPDHLKNKLKQAWIGTIHSICWRMLMENGQLVGLQPNWSVLDMPDSHRVMSFCGKAYYFDFDTSKKVYAMYSYSRNALRDWRELAHSQRFPEIPRSENVANLLRSYQRRCLRSNRVDFDDLLVLALKLLEENKEVRRQYQDRFRVIMVDEYQDTNLIQSKILRLLASKENVITVVGDDAQSIYGFRAATVDNILNFETDFHAKRVTIRTNYRSTPEIVALANASIRNNRRQIYKEIRANLPSSQKPILFRGDSISDEASFIVKQIKSKLTQGKKLSDIAVLFRATSQSANLTIDLKREEIPFILVGGEDFYSLSHIKYVMDMARLLINPDDSIALSALQELIGFSTAGTLEIVEQEADQTQLAFWDIAKEFFSGTGQQRSDSVKDLISFEREINKLQNIIIEGQSITPIISAILDYLEPYLKRKFSNNWNDVQSDFDILQSVASQFISLGDFLNSVALQQFIDLEPEDDVLVLSTIHSAKGLEWDTVFVIGLVEFWFPNNWAIQQSGTDEEERRLFYVAVTRAKKALYLSTYYRATNRYGREMEQKTSRFVIEIPQSLYFQ